MEKHEFKPKEWVLVRDDDEQWKLDIFSHCTNGETFPYHCVGDYYAECLPYEGNEHLLGSDKPADTPMELDGWKVGDEVEVQWCVDDKWYAGKIVEIDRDFSQRFVGAAHVFRVKSECFNRTGNGVAWCARNQIRRPEEKKEKPFEFGAKVRWYDEDIKEWRDGLYVMDDGTPCIPLLVYIPEDNDTTYLGRDEVRHA